MLCSPAAARSRWVNQEVIDFKKLGRADRVHALIIDGDPGAAPDKGGCFPPALVSKLADDGTLTPDPSHEVLAADLRPEGDGRDEAKLKLIAGLLGIPFNSLRRREAAAARKRLLITQAIAASMMLLAIAAGVGGWLTLRYSKESDERQVPGVRVEYHETTLDLSDWHETTPVQIAQHQKISFGAVARPLHHREDTTAGNELRTYCRHIERHPGGHHVHALHDQRTSSRCRITHIP